MFTSTSSPGRLSGPAAVLCAAFLVSPAAADPPGEGASFAYTSLELDRCEVVNSNADEEEGPGWAHWRCEGLTEDWPVHVTGSDLRFTVSYGPKAMEEPAAQHHFASFNRIHDKLEWVLTKAPGDRELKPVATILRFFFSLDGGNGEPREHPILVVTQLKPGAVCQIAYVDPRANSHANRDAREAALRLAGSHDCESVPELVGPQSPGIFME